jgi:GT2 family glycosyltransferase
VTGEFTIIALIAAYNEGDVIGPVVGDLIDQGVSVYLLDHQSTDDTVARVEPYRGRGLLSIERFPGTGTEVGGPGRFVWEEILRRKEALATELDAAWFIHHDADEFRESPWAHVNLRDAIRRVDALGYNAIDFELLNFWPTHDGFTPGDDVRRAFHHYAPGEPWDKVQIKCWKKTGGLVDLVSSAGHEAAFAGRRVFPLRFMLRHYPIRSQAHGQRKVFHERRGRFVEAERARGWHVQYDAIRPDERFIRDPATLIWYDPEQVRLQLLLRHREVEALQASFAAEREKILSELGTVEHDRTRLGQHLDALRTARSWRAGPAARAAGAGTRHPRISVIIPCYNLGEYLDEAVDSVRAQSFDDWEIIIVNDGSTDPATNRLLADYQRPRTRVLSTDNRGLPAARNLAIAHAAGAYLCALDADDKLEPQYLERAVARLEADPTLGFVSSWLETFGEERWVWKQDRCDLAALLAECTVCTAAVVRTSAVEAVGGYDETMTLGYEDWDLWISLVERGIRGVIIPEVLFRYRRRAGSMSSLCSEGPVHLGLIEYLVRKHRTSYQTHLPEVLLLKEAALQRVVVTARERDRAAQEHALAQGREMSALRTGLTDAERTVTRLMTSRSWRLTAPLRSASDWLARVRAAR